MAPRPKPVVRPAVAQAAKKVLRRPEPDTDVSLQTGSEAPSEVSARPLEASIGFEVRRLRKSIDLTVAELGAAFLSADLELTPELRDEHASYIESWLKVLKGDSRAIFTAASHAQRAADFLHGLQAGAEAEVAA